MARNPIQFAEISPTVTRQPRVSGGALGAPGRGLRQLGQAGIQAAEDAARAEAVKEEARRGAELMRRNAAATRELNDLSLSFERDTDFDTAPQRFEEAAQGIFDRHTQEIDDDDVRTLFERDFGNLFETKRVDVNRKAFAAETDATVAALDAILPDYARFAASSASEAERLEYLRQGRAAISGMAVAGFITNTDAVARDQGFLAGIDEAEARAMITADPEAAIEALLDNEEFINLDEVRRARLVDMAAARAESDAKEAVRAADKADREAEKEVARIGDERLREAFSRDADGTLTRGFVDEIRGDVTPAEFRSLLKLVDPASADVKDDPDAFRELQLMLDEDPGGAGRLALRYHADGLIGNDTLKSTRDKARGLEAGPRAGFDRARAFLKDSLTPSPMLLDPAPRQRQAEALREFDDFALSADRTPAELRARADELVGQFAAIDLRDIVLPRPRFGGPIPRGDPAAAEAALKAAEADTVRRWQAGEINAQELSAEALIFERWRDSLDRAAAAAANRGTRK